MQINDLNSKDIINDNNINSHFLSVNHKKIDISCKFYVKNFYIDSFNFFPISEANNTFSDLFVWGDQDKYNNFFTKNFENTFNQEKFNFKKFSNITVLGSSVSDNYYRNMITFLPRIFFINQQNVSIALHRSSSNKFRAFIRNILGNLGIQLKEFIFLDDNFYKFDNSQIPQFFNKKISIEILRNYFSKYREKNREKKIKIYVSRQNSNYRNLVNEGDIIDELKLKDFKIIDPNNISIIDQIELFSSASIIISPTSSALTNIIFAPNDAQIIEITPKYSNKYEAIFKNRYSNICQAIGLNYNFIEADPIDINPIKNKISNFIPEKILNESNYYKNLIIEKNKFNKLINNF